jgi:hypothetical protein
MTRRWIGCSLSVVALVLASCSSNGGDGTPPSLPVSIPADLATVPPDAGPEPTAPSVQPPAEPAAPEAEAPVDVAPPAEAADPDAAPEESPVDAAVDEDADSTWWIWALFAVAIIAVIALVASSAGRRRRAAAQWRTDTRATLDEIDQLTMRLGVAAPEAIGPVAVDGSARLATMGFSLQRLIDTAPDDASKSALAQVQAPLTNVRELVDSIALSPPPPTANTVEVLRARASSLHSTSASARAALSGA